MSKLPSPPPVPPQMPVFTPVSPLVAQPPPLELAVHQGVVGMSQPLNPVAHEAYRAVVRKLWNITPPSNILRVGLHQMTLAFESRQILMAFQKEIEPQLGKCGKLSLMRAWGAKLPGQCVRVATLMQAVHHWGDERFFIEPIHPWWITQVITMAKTYLIPHAIAAHYGHQDMELVRKAQVILAAIEERNEKKLTVKRAKLHNWLQSTFSRVEELVEPLALLEEHGYVQEILDPKAGGRGRPSIVYSVHPSLLQ